MRNLTFSVARSPPRFQQPKSAPGTLRQATFAHRLYNMTLLESHEKRNSPRHLFLANPVPGGPLVQFDFDHAVLDRSDFQVAWLT